MGCIISSQRVGVTPMPTSQSSWQHLIGKETVLAALARLDQDIAKSETFYPAQRLAVISAELESIQQMFVNLDLYKRPMLAAENEDFVANVNRKEMRRLELVWLRSREKELKQERRLLHAQLLRIRSLYSQLQQLLGVIWSDNQRPDLQLEDEFGRAHSMRNALASVSTRLRAAVEYAHSALRLLDDALPAWKLASIGKSGWERTAACGDACMLLVRARCQERCARRVLAASAAPRAARSLRLALDYAFTDTMHDHKYQRATEIFLQFKEALVQLVNSIHQVFLNNIENLAVTEKELAESRRKVRAARVNYIVKKGLADLKYDPTTLESLKGLANNT
ncbi:jg14291 [Pararge aegeria aegeria]|uniref:Jg14291 protein n=1 Tax=Pararge aegeria aegeria TaxID=348720 RepID=A0A8S4RRM9_9NEOP|nr:jg14291 [Pararge aegeria aegeria]